MKLIILHGWNSSHEKWAKVKCYLEEKGVEVFAPDMPGFKPEYELKKTWDLDDYVDWFEKFSGGFDDFVIAGHSFGGRMGIKYGSKNPEKLKGLILISSAGIKKEEDIRRYFLSIGASIARKLNLEELPIIRDFWKIFRKAFYKFIIRKSDYPYTSGYLKPTIKNILDEDLTDLLDEIKKPTNIIWGDKDAITPYEDAVIMNKKIKGSTLTTLHAIGHTPHIECPKKLADKIYDFYKTVS